MCGGGGEACIRHHHERARVHAPCPNGACCMRLRPTRWGSHTHTHTHTHTPSFTQTQRGAGPHLHGGAAGLQAHLYGACTRRSCMHVCTCTCPRCLCILHADTAWRRPTRLRGSSQTSSTSPRSSHSRCAVRAVSPRSQCVWGNVHAPLTWLPYVCQQQPRCFLALHPQVVSWR